jgi:hypothetical protein
MKTCGYHQERDWRGECAPTREAQNVRRSPGSREDGSIGIARRPFEHHGGQDR